MIYLERSPGGHLFLDLRLNFEMSADCILKHSNKNDQMSIGESKAFCHKEIHTLKPTEFGNIYMKSSENNPRISNV